MDMSYISIEHYGLLSHLSLPQYGNQSEEGHESCPASRGVHLHAPGLLSYLSQSRDRLMLMQCQCTL